MYIDLKTFSSKQGFKILGAIGGGVAPCSYGDATGLSVSGIGDINNDTLPDFIIGANSALCDPGTGNMKGATYVIFGNKGGFSDVDLLKLNMPVGFRVTGAECCDQIGYSVSGAGDINNDGIADFIIGAAASSPLGRTNAGTSYVIFGKKQSDVFSNIDLANPPPSYGFKIIGAKTGDYSGSSVSRLSDVNGDKIDDIIIGAPGASLASFPERGRPGACYVVYGKTTGFTDIDLLGFTGPLGFTIMGAQNGYKTGSSVKSDGDINNDTLNDIIIGAHTASPQSRSEAGESYLIFGGVPQDVDLANLPLSYGFKIQGANAGDHSGCSVSGAGDVNKDGFADIVIGAYFAQSGAGESYVIFGKTANFSYIDLLNLSLPSGFKIQGAVNSDRSGYSVSSAGDINNDGFKDIIIGAYNAFPFNRSVAGAAYVIYGKAYYSGDIDLSHLVNSSTWGVRIAGANINDQSGNAVSGVGDINKDGVDDLIVGAYRASPLGRWGAGESYIVYGFIQRTIDLGNFNSTQGVKANGEQVRERNGNSVGGNVDLNNDGIADVIIGAPLASVFGRAEAGRVTVLFGKKNGTLLADVPGFEIIGSDPLDNAGCSISTAGDLNNDGIGDIIIGANMATPPVPGRTNAGVSYVIYGQPGSSGFNQIVNLTDLDHDLKPNLGFAIFGANAGDLSGSQVLGGFDANNDKISDVIIVTNNSSPLSSGYGGEAYILYGKNGDYTSIDLNSTFFLGPKGFRIFGESTLDKAEFTLNSGFDINADNITDIIVGSSMLSPLNRTHAGTSYVIYGRTGLNLSNIELSNFTLTQGFKLFGSQEYEFSGQAVGYAGDLNHDGLSDVFITAPGNFSCDNYTLGTSYILYGVMGGYDYHIDLAEFNSTYGFKILWENSHNQDSVCFNFTVAVTGIGDVSGDGIDDLIIGLSGASYGNRTQNGVTYLVYGKEGGYVEDVYLNMLSSIDGTLLIGAKSFDATGNAIALAGDFNGDGINDVVIGAYNTSILNLTSTGSAYIIYGGKNFNQSFVDSETNINTFGVLAGSAIYEEIHIIN